MSIFFFNFPLISLTQSSLSVLSLLISTSSLLGYNFTLRLLFHKEIGAIGMKIFRLLPLKSQIFHTYLFIIFSCQIQMEAGFLLLFITKPLINGMESINTHLSSLSLYSFPLLRCSPFYFHGLPLHHHSYFVLASTYGRNLLTLTF